jgi:hypothetical protein
LSIEDLRTLAEKVEVFAEQSADRELETLPPSEAQTPEQLEQVRQHTRSLLHLRIQVQDDDGEWSSGPAAVVLSDKGIPDVVDQIIFDTTYDFRVQVGRGPLNGVTFTLDFRRRALMDFSNAADAAAENASGGAVHGADTTWADSVHQKLDKWFRERRDPWGWLHGSNTYDFLLMLIGIPITFLWANRIDHFLTIRVPSLVPAVHVGGMIYFVFVMFYVFRFLFNYACRLFPRLRGPRKGTGGNIVEGTFLVGAVLAWLMPPFFNALWKWLGL